MSFESGNYPEPSPRTERELHQESLAESNAPPQMLREIRRFDSGEGGV